jgi:hypothetical protein
MPQKSEPYAMKVIRIVCPEEQSKTTPQVSVFGEEEPMTMNSKSTAVRKYGWTLK